jgi:VCBS repeat-containing protein
VSLIEAGDYHISIDAVDLPLLDQNGNDITTVNSAIKIADVNAFQLSSSQLTWKDYDPDTSADVQKVINLSTTDSTLTIDGITSLNLQNLINAADDNSINFKSPTLSLELVKVPNGSGTGSITFKIIDGSDASVDSGERTVELTMGIAWTGDGTDAEITIPTQNILVTYSLASGSILTKVIQNLDDDTISVNNNGVDYPTTLDIKFASIIDKLESVGSVSLIEAGDYHISIDAVDLPLLDQNGNDITTVNSAIKIADVDLPDVVTIYGQASSEDVDNNNNEFIEANDESAAYGSYSVSESGEWSYTLDSSNINVNSLGEGDSINDFIEITSVDGTSYQAKVVIEGVNDAPTSTTDSFTLPESTNVILDVLSNDSDADGDVISIKAILSSHGLDTTENGANVSIVNGKVSYKSADNFSGVDSFTYIATDGVSDSELIQVNITVVSDIV